MPQLTLEYSSNIIEKTQMPALFQKCHTILAEMLPADINACKSRAIECSDFYIGNGEKTHAFVYLKIQVLPIRTQAVREATANAILPVLKEHFYASLNALALQIIVEMSELSSIYLKVTA